MKILIIKAENNDFEKYFSEKMRLYADVKTESEIYNKTIHTFHKISAMFKINIIKYIYIYIFDLNKYDKVIVFDNQISQKFIDCLIWALGNSRIILWLWNTYDKLPVENKNVRIKCFDFKTSQKLSIEYINQFYIPMKNKKNNINNDVLFIGEDKGRTGIILRLAKILNENNINYRFMIHKNRNIKNKYIEYYSDFLKYEEVVNLAMQSKCIVDIVKKEQEGITLRTLEALYYNKKIITNNISIKKFDFYSPERIFIIDTDNNESLYNFVNNSIKTIDDKILQEYSFETWLKNIIK